ncbi:Kinetochore-associated protein 1 [Sparganum proliferum]
MVINRKRDGAGRLERRVGRKHSEYGLAIPTWIRIPPQTTQEYHNFIEPRVIAAFPVGCITKSQFINRGYVLALNRQLLLYNVVAGICCGPLFPCGDIIDFAVWNGAFMHSEVQNSPFPTFGLYLLRRSEDKTYLEVHLFPSRKLVFATPVSERSHLISTVSGSDAAPLLVEIGSSSDSEELQTVSLVVRIDPLERTAELLYCLESLADAADKLEKSTEEDQETTAEFPSLEETVQRAIRLLSKPVDCTSEVTQLAVRGVIPALKDQSELLLSLWKKVPEDSEEGQLAEFASQLDSTLVGKYLHVLAQRPLTTTDEAPEKAAPALVESEEALHTWLQTEFLEAIILHCPDALGTIATWLINRVQMLERVCQNQTDCGLGKTQCPFQWPDTAISWIRGLLVAVPKTDLDSTESTASANHSPLLTPREEVRIYCSGLCSRTFGVDPFAELRSLLYDLEHIKSLLDTTAELLYCLESLADAADKLEKSTEEDQETTAEFISLEETAQRAIRLLSKPVDCTPEVTQLAVPEDSEEGQLAEFASQLDSTLVGKYLHVLAQRPLTTTDEAPEKAAAALVESEEALHTWLQTEFLEAIILHCPDALGTIATWLINRVQMLERVCQNQADCGLGKTQCPFQWPDTAISWIRGLLVAVPKTDLDSTESTASANHSPLLTPREEVRIYCSGLCSRTFGVDPFAELRSLLYDLEHIKSLLDTYQFRLPLADCRKLSPQNIAFKMLDVTLASGASTNISPRIETYIKGNKLNPDQVYASYCMGILENLKMDLDEGTSSAFAAVSNFTETPKHGGEEAQKMAASSPLIHKEVRRACIAASWIRSSVYRCKVTYLLSGVTPLPWPVELHQVVDETLRVHYRPGVLPALDRVLRFSNIAKAVDILTRLGVAFDLADLRPRPLLSRILLLTRPPCTSGRVTAAAVRISRPPKEVLLDAVRVAYYLKSPVQDQSSAQGSQPYWLCELCSLYLEQTLEDVITVWDEAGEVDVQDRLNSVLPAISQLTDMATNFAGSTGITDSTDGVNGAATVDPDAGEFVWRRWLYESCFRWLRNRLRVIQVSKQTAMVYLRLAAHVSCLAVRAKVCSREANLWLSYARMMERLLILTDNSTFCPHISPELAENISPPAGVQLARHLFSTIICPALHSEDSKQAFSPVRVTAFQSLLFWLCGHSIRDACFPLDDLISLHLFETWLKDSQPASATLLSTLDDLLQRLHWNSASCSEAHLGQTPVRWFFQSDSSPHSCTHRNVWGSGLGRLGFILRLLSESLLPTVLHYCSLSGDVGQDSFSAAGWDLDAAQIQVAIASAIVVRVADLVDSTATAYCFGRPDLAEFVYCLRRIVSVLRWVFSKFFDLFSSENCSKTLADPTLTKLKLWAVRSEDIRENFGLEAVHSFTVNTLRWLQRFFSLVLQSGVLLHNKELTGPRTVEIAQLDTSSNITVDGERLPSLFVDGVQLATILATKAGLVDSAALPLSCTLVELVLTLCPTTNDMRRFMASMDSEAGHVYTDLLTSQLPQWLAYSVSRHFTSSRPDHSMVLGLSLSLPFATANSCLRQIIADSPSATNRIKSITAMLVKSNRLLPLIYTPALVKSVLDLLRRAQWDATLRPYGLRMSRRDPRPDLVLQHLVKMVPTLGAFSSPTVGASSHLSGGASSSTKPLPPVDLLAKFCAAFKQDFWTALLSHLRLLLCPPSDFDEVAPLHATQQYSQSQSDATLKAEGMATSAPNPLAVALKLFSEARQSRAQEILKRLLKLVHQQGSTDPKKMLTLRRDLEQCLNEGLQSTWPFDYEQIRFILQALSVLGSDLIESRHKILLRFLETHHRQSPTEVISQTSSSEISRVHPPSSNSALTYHPLYGVRLPFHQLLSPSVDLVVIGPELNRHNLRNWLQLSAQMQWNLTDRMRLRTASNCFTPLVRMGLVRVIDGPVAAAAAAAADACKFFPYTTSTDRSTECWEEALAADALLGPALAEAFSFLVSVTDHVRTLKFLADLFVRLRDGPPKLAFLNLIRRLIKHWHSMRSPDREATNPNQYSFSGDPESSDLYWINLALRETDVCEQKLQIEACLHRFQITTFWPNVLLHTPTSSALVEFLLEQASHLISEKTTPTGEGDRRAGYPPQHSNRRHLVPLLYDALREILRLQGVDFEIWSRQLVWQRLQLPKSICSEWDREENVDLNATAITFDPESSVLMENAVGDISLNMTISSPPEFLHSAKTREDTRREPSEDDFNLAEFLLASPWYPTPERISPPVEFGPVIELLRTWSTPAPNLIASLQASELSRRWRAARLVLRCSPAGQTADFHQHHLDFLALAVRFNADAARFFLPASLRSSLSSHMMAFIASGGGGGGGGADDFLHLLLQLANSGDQSLGLIRHLAVNLLVDEHLADSADAAHAILEGLICRPARWPNSLTPLLLRLQEFILTSRCTSVPWSVEEPGKTGWQAFWRSCDAAGTFGPALISHLLRGWMQQSSAMVAPGPLPYLVAFLLCWPLPPPASVYSSLRQFCAVWRDSAGACSLLRQLERLVAQMSPAASTPLLLNEKEEEKENRRPPKNLEGLRKCPSSRKSPSLQTALADSDI